MQAWVRTNMATKELMADMVIFVRNHSIRAAALCDSFALRKEIIKSKPMVWKKIKSQE